MTNTNSIQLFNYGENPVRTILQDGEIWFVAKDICDILEIKNVTQALSTLDDDEKMTLSNAYSHETSGKCGGASTLKVINESGLYALIFKSIKPEAREFRKWVTGTVLPQIRKTGSFTVEQSGQPQEAQPKQKALPDSALQSEIVKIKRRINFFQDVLKRYTEFEKTFLTTDQFYQHIIKWPDYMNDDGKDLRHMADILNMFRDYTRDKLYALEEKLRALETLAKF